MNDEAVAPIVFDATVLSNFASTDAVDWLVEHLTAPLTPHAVLRELEAGVEVGHDFLRPAVAAIGDERIDVVRADELAIASPSDGMKTLDSGERASLYIARAKSVTMATDDARARTVATDWDVRVTGSIGLLARGVELGVLELETADDWLQHWIDRHHYYAPVDSVREALSDR